MSGGVRVRTRASFGTLLALAWRESRTARRRLLLYMSSISLGVAALVAIDSYAANVQESIAAQSRALMGGDANLRARQTWTPASDSLLDSLAANGVPVAKVTSFASIVANTRPLPDTRARLAQVRAVGAGYPFYGTVVTSPADRWAELGEGRYVMMDPALFNALGVAVGDSLQIGYARFEIRAVLTNVPGDPGMAATVAPRVFIAERYVDDTRLLTTGSRAEYESVVKLAEGVNARAWVDGLRPRFDSLNVRARSYEASEAELTDAIAQLARFLGVVGLVALLLGGIGVASGVNAFVQRKIDTVAVLRCLGATGAQVLTIYLLQAGAMGFLGASAGAALGVAIQFSLARVLGDFLPVDVMIRAEPLVILTGIGIGVWVAVAFALRPLLVLRRVSPLQAIRRDDEALAASRRRDTMTHLTNFALVASVFAFAIDRAETVGQGVGFAAGVFLSIGVLWVSATALSALTRRLVSQRWPYVMRQGIVNLHRPASQTRAVVLALGFGSFLVSTIVLVQSNLLAAFDITAQAARGNVVFFDVQTDQRDSIRTMIGDAGHAVVGETPIIVLRFDGANGLDRAEWSRRHQAASGWATRREYRSTYRDTLVTTEKLLRGKWFTPAAAGDSIYEVSLERDIATELALDIGDTVRWDVQGIPVLTEVTSIREVDWGQFELNFFAVFETAAIARAPKQFVTIAAVDGDTAVARLQGAIAQRYPNVSSIDLSLVRNTIGQIVDKVTLTVRFLALFSFAMGVPVLFSAVAATRRDRLREGVLLKTLGATRAQIGRILLAEYAVLGLLGSLTGMVLAFGGAWLLITQVFDGTFRVTPLPALGIAGAMTALAVSIGLLTGRDVFRETPMAVLREV